MSGAVGDLEQQEPSARQDDGLFGPDSVTWRLFTDPASTLGAVCGVLLQSLNPDMMTLFSKVSDNYGDPVGRAARTVKYLDTTIFGDTAHALAAGEAVRRMHRHAQWTDERTGRTLIADDPDWLAWTYNTLVWGILRSSELYGPSLTAAERDRFVTEQHLRGADRGHAVGGGRAPVPQGARRRRGTPLTDPGQRAAGPDTHSHTAVRTSDSGSRRSRTRRCRSARCSTTPSPHSTTTTADARSVSRSSASS